MTPVETLLSILDLERLEQNLFAVMRPLLAGSASMAGS